MLLAHFTLFETGFAPDLLEDKPDLLLLARTRIQMAMEKAERLTDDQLRHISPYDKDGGHPYLVPYVGQWQHDGGLDCATEWCEVYKGLGVHVGLVVEGKATGPLYHDSTEPGVHAEDFDDLVVETFLRHLNTALQEDAHPWFAPKSTYVVTDWAFYERCSDEYGIDFDIAKESA